MIKITDDLDIFQCTFHTLSLCTVFALLTNSQDFNLNGEGIIKESISLVNIICVLYVTYF